MKNPFLRRDFPYLLIEKHRYGDRHHLVADEEQLERTLRAIYRERADDTARGYYDDQDTRALTRWASLYGETFAIALLLHHCSDREYERIDTQALSVA